MPSDIDLSFVLDAIDSIKTDVAHLKSKVDSVEQRVSKLEAATYTPPASPFKEFFGNEAIEPQPETPEPATGPVLHPEERPSTTSGPSVPTTVKECDCHLEVDSSERPCELKRHLQPINAGIESLTKHLLRIEQAIASPVSASDSAEAKETSPENACSTSSTQATSQNHEEGSKQPGESSVGGPAGPSGDPSKPTTNIAVTDNQFGQLLEKLIGNGSPIANLTVNVGKRASDQGQPQVNQPTTATHSSPSRLPGDTVVNPPNPAITVTSEIEPPRLPPLCSAPGPSCAEGCVFYHPAGMLENVVDTPLTGHPSLVGAPSTSTVSGASSGQSTAVPNAPQGPTAPLFGPAAFSSIQRASSPADLASGKSDGPTGAKNQNAGESQPRSSWSTMSGPSGTGNPPGIAPGNQATGPSPLFGPTKTSDTLGSTPRNQTTGPSPSQTATTPKPASSLSSFGVGNTIPAAGTPLAPVRSRLSLFGAASPDQKPASPLFPGCPTPAAGIQQAQIPLPSIQSTGPTQKRSVSLFDSFEPKPRAEPLHGQPQSTLAQKSTPKTQHPPRAEPLHGQPQLTLSQKSTPKTQPPSFSFAHSSSKPQGSTNAPSNLGKSIFGQPSTPSLPQPPTPFKIEGSSFGNYSDKQSPFAKLPARSSLFDH